MEENGAEDQQAELARKLKASHPEADIDSLVAGSLAGPASPDRPPVPAWEYLNYLASHPELSINDLSRTRFPVALQAGTTMVTSIAELIAPGPVPVTYQVTAEDVVRLYQLMHEAGVMRWNPQTRTHEEIAPPASVLGGGQIVACGPI